MDLYIGNISSNTTEIDITQFICNNAGVRDFNRVNIVQKHQAGKLNRYAMVGIVSAKQARNAISKINGMALRGERLLVREFCHRTSNNEQRDLNWRTRVWQGDERRMVERRGGGLILEGGVSAA
ncbi:MAG: hypothetical protein BMS9Abin26_0441 [Gammaproteobacteria bacterium]|nr:MAG: hypothetical protein BMS9Abin26_0441 [Gammaproteobacteria bacterium]